MRCILIRRCGRSCHMLRVWRRRRQRRRRHRHVDRPSTRRQRWLRKQRGRGRRRRGLPYPTRLRCAVLWRRVGDAVLRLLHRGCVREPPPRRRRLASCRARDGASHSRLRRRHGARRSQPRRLALHARTRCRGACGACDPLCRLALQARARWLCCGWQVAIPQGRRLLLVGDPLALPPQSLLLHRGRAGTLCSNGHGDERGTDAVRVAAWERCVGRWVVCVQRLQRGGGISGTRAIEHHLVPRC